MIPAESGSAFPVKKKTDTELSAGLELLIVMMHEFLPGETVINGRF